MIIFEIDQSSRKCGYAIFKDKELIYSKQFTLQEGKEDFIEKRYEKMYVYLKDLFKRWEPDVVVTEDPASLFRVNPKVGRILTKMLGVITIAAIHYGIAIIELSPSQIKKEFTGKGNAKKKDVVKEVKKRFPEQNILDEEEDRADAIAIGVTFINLQV